MSALTFEHAKEVRKEITANGVAMTVALLQSEYRTLQPTLSIRVLGSSLGSRKGRSLALMAMAIAELGTPSNERWIVQSTLRNNGAWWVYLELIDGTEAEAEVGMTTLCGVCEEMAEKVCPKIGAL